MVMKQVIRDGGELGWVLIGTLGVTLLLVGRALRRPPAADGGDGTREPGRA
jgi:hypothetical protein